MIVSDDLELSVKDGKVRKKDGTIAQNRDVPLRTDLPEDHPLYGLRALPVVLAGQPDMTVDDDGRMAPIDYKTGLPAVEENLEAVR